MQSEKQKGNKDKNGKEMAPWLWKPGQSGNPKGRPKGKTMKEHVRSLLERMTDEERDLFLMGIPKAELWRMAEGNPHSTEDKQVTVAMPTPILGGASNAKHIEAHTVDELTEAVSDVVIEEETGADSEV